MVESCAACMREKLGVKIKNLNEALLAMLPVLGYIYSTEFCFAFVFVLSLVRCSDVDA